MHINFNFRVFCQIQSCSNDLFTLQEWISDISVGHSIQSQGNHIKASSVYVAFNTDTAGTNTFTPKCYSLVQNNIGGNIGNGLNFVTRDHSFKRELFSVVCNCNLYRRRLAHCTSTRSEGPTG